MSGKPLGCYVLADDKGGGTFCMGRQPFGEQQRAIDALASARPTATRALACTLRSGRESVSGPYCDLADRP